MKNLMDSLSGIVMAVESSIPDKAKPLQLISMENQKDGSVLVTIKSRKSPFKQWQFVVNGKFEVKEVDYQKGGEE